MSLKKAVNFVMAPLGTIIGGKTGKLVSAAGWIVLGAMTGNPQLIAAGLAKGASALKKGPKVSPAALDRLDASLDPNAFRKLAFGQTALNTDVRYMAYTGTSQEYLEQIVCTASHQAEAHDEIWFDSEKAWTSLGGAQGRYAGYLTVTSRLVGTSANGIAIDSVWTASATLTGCAYLHIKYKLQGTKKAESPFASGVPSRMTIRGKGARVPDPRLSTSAGGSGSQSMSDQTTWAYTTAADSGRNPICQILFYLLGWRINNKLAVGKGWAPARIDFASFIAAANICDESVAKTGGGTRPRYRSDYVCSEGDDPATALAGLLEACNAELVDSGGKIGIRIDYDDLATPAAALTEDDIIDGDDWPLSESARDVNIVKGQYPDPSDGSLYQPRDYPQVTLGAAPDYGSPDGIQRIEPFPLPAVQDPAQAQHLAALRLQRRQYPGRFSARFKKKAWAASYGKVVTLTHASTAFSAKKFRVARQVLNRDGSVDLVLREVASAMYAAPSEASVVAAAAPTAFNPNNNPLAILQGSDIGVANGATAGRNLLLNAGAESGSASPWVVDSQTSGAGPFTLAADTTSPLAGKYRFLLSKPASGQGCAAIHPALQVAPGKTYLVRMNVSGNGSSSASGLYLAVNQATSAPAGGYVYSSIRNSFTDLSPNGPVTTGYTQYVFNYTVPAGVTFVSLILYSWVGAPASIAFDDIEFYELTDYELNADVTKTAQVVVVPPVDQVIEADSAGAPLTGQLQVLWAKVTKGGADIRTAAGTTYAITTVGVTATVDNVAGSATKGQITPTAMSAVDGYVDLSVIVDGIVQPLQRIKFHKNVAPADVAAGAAGATSDSRSAFAGTASASYGSAATTALVVRAPASGIVNLAGVLNFRRTTTSAGSSGAHGKWAWRIVGGVLADLPSGETASTANAQTVNEPPVTQYPGALPMNGSKTGLTPGSDYEFVPYLRSDAATQLNFTGTLSATQG